MNLYENMSRFLSKRGDEKVTRKFPEILDDQSGNVYSELVLLSSHPNVEKIIKLEEKKILTCGQDTKGVIWNCVDGSVISELVGHTRLINCAFLMKNKKTDQSKSAVVTGSSDQTIRIWEMQSGSCLKVISKHESRVKCFAVGNKTELNLVVSGGQNLCVWNSDLQLLTQHQRNTLDYIHTVLLLQNMMIVTATDQKFLVVYSISSSAKSTEDQIDGFVIKRRAQLPSHRESITTLISISDSIFSSASIDGTIIIWSSLHFNPLKKFNKYEDFVSLTDHTHPYSVQFMLVVQKTYLFAAVGCGISIFNILRGTCLCKISEAHRSQITCIALLEEGAFLATSSLDGTVRLWAGTGNEKVGDPCMKNPVSKLFRISDEELKDIESLSLKLIGVCYAHSNSIQSIVEVGEEGFVSCSSDGVVILWKNAEVNDERRDDELRSLLLKNGWVDR